MQTILVQTDEPMSVNFSDLCTLANCSVLMMTDRYRGYYINGKAPWDRSDLPMSWLKMELDNYADNKRKSRGQNIETVNLTNEEASQIGNTYEIFMKPELRRTYDSIKDDPLENMSKYRQFSEQEKKEAAERKKQMEAKKNADKKVVKEAGESNADIEEITEAEKKIIREERKKRMINYILC